MSEIDHNRELLIERLKQEFVSSRIQHGQEFDDGRRWCSNCGRPKLVCIATEETPLANKMCEDCNGIWPEWEDYIMAQMDDLGEDDIDIDLME